MALREPGVHNVRVLIHMFPQKLKECSEFDLSMFCGGKVTVLNIVQLHCICTRKHSVQPEVTSGQSGLSCLLINHLNIVQVLVDEVAVYIVVNITVQRCWYANCAGLVHGTIGRNCYITWKQWTK